MYVAYLRSDVPQLHLMQLLAVKAYEPFGTIRLSLYQLRFFEEHAALMISLWKIILMKLVYLSMCATVQFKVFLAMKEHRFILRKITLFCMHLQRPNSSTQLITDCINKSASI